MISNEGMGDAVRDGLRGANHSNSLAIARICNDADRPKPRPHTHEEIVNTFLGMRTICLRGQALLLLLIGCISLLWTAPTVAQPSLLAVKAALLFKLPRFTYLTHLEGSSVLNLCILGTNPFGDALHALAQTPIDARTVVLHTPATAETAQVCDIIFIADTAENKRNLNENIQTFSTYHALTVSDIAGFAQAGGMVELATHAQDSSKVHILINPTAAARQGVKLNAQLLRLATLLP